MALPKIKHPTYPVTIPSSKKKITLRPFTVQEEKLLFMAKSSEASDDILSAVKQIIQNCITEKVDVDKLATFDIEYLFIKLRSKSVGEVVDLEYNDPDTKETIKFQVNLDDIEIKNHPDHSNKIIVQGDIGMVMRYPTLEEIKSIDRNKGDDTNAIFDVLYACIEKIFDDDKVYNDFSREELLDFINTLPMDSMEKVKTFFNTMPSVEHTVKLKNKQGDTREVVLKGINSFFT